MTDKLTDEQIIERCKASGIKWIPPELPDDCDYELGFPGSFDMVSMDEMRTLLAAQQVTNADKLDAERYRWLRHRMREWASVNVINDLVRRSVADHLDAAIDAARAHSTNRSGGES